jgi:hypothetical protein
MDGKDYEHDSTCGVSVSHSNEEQWCQLRPHPRHIPGRPETAQWAVALQDRHCRWRGRKSQCEPFPFVTEIKNIFMEVSSGVKMCPLKIRLHNILNGRISQRN